MFYIVLSVFQVISLLTQDFNNFEKNQLNVSRRTELKLKKRDSSVYKVVE